MKRGEVLQHASALITGPRQNDYGDARQMATRIADNWTVQLGKHLKPGERIEPHEALLCMAGMKLARLAYDTSNLDTYADALGYIALACEIALEAE